MCLRPIPCEGPLEAFAKGGPRREAEFLGSLRDVGMGIANVAGTRVDAFRGDWDAGDLRKEPGQFVDRGRGPRTHVDDLSRDGAFPRDLQGRRAASYLQEDPRLPTAAEAPASPL